MNDVFVAPKHVKQVIPVLSDSENLGILSSFCKNPQGASFQTQKHNEAIFLFLRAHIITNLSWVLIAIFLAVLPLIIALTLPMLNINIFSSANIARFTAIYVLFYYLVVSSYVFVSFLHWFYNVFLVSSERIVDIDYSDIVIHNIAITNLNHLEDVNYTQSGFISTLFNYGNVFVQTAGNERNFEALAIPKPREVTHIIGDLIGKGG